MNRCALLVGVILIGCAVSQDRPFSGDRAVERVKRTPVFRDLTSDILEHVRLDVDATGSDYVTIAVYEAGRGDDVLLATFRALPDGRVYVWDFERNDWRIAGVFE